MNIQVTRDEVAKLIEKAPLNYPLNFSYKNTIGIMIASSNSWEALVLQKMRKATEEIKCFYCEKPIEQPVPGMISGSILTDGDQSVKKAVPGGTIFGNTLGYVCYGCSAFNKDIIDEKS